MLSSKVMSVAPVLQSLALTTIPRILGGFVRVGEPGSRAAHA
jgi:hypothetical protein